MSLCHRLLCHLYVTTCSYCLSLSPVWSQVSDVIVSSIVSYSVVFVSLSLVWSQVSVTVMSLSLSIVSSVCYKMLILLLICLKYGSRSVASLRHRPQCQLHVERWLLSIMTAGNLKFL